MPTSPTITEPSCPVPTGAPTLLSGNSVMVQLAQQTEIKHAVALGQHHNNTMDDPVPELLSELLDLKL